MFINLVKYIVAEQLDDVPIAGLRPASVSSELGALVDEAKLAHEPEEARVLEFAEEFVFEAIGGPVRDQTK
jgi:hypothetical protein